MCDNIEDKEDKAHKSVAMVGDGSRSITECDEITRRRTRLAKMIKRFNQPIRSTTLGQDQQFNTFPKALLAYWHTLFPIPFQCKVEKLFFDNWFTQVSFIAGKLGANFMNYPINGK